VYVVVNEESLNQHTRLGGFGGIGGKTKSLVLKLMISDHKVVAESYLVHLYS
jgi:hypothetical protein